MNIADSGINKPFDRILKAFADEAPELFVRLLGVVPPGSTVEITPLRAETAPAVVMPDFVAALAVGAGEPFVFHVEFVLKYSADVPSTMARYGGSLAWQYYRPVRSVLVLLRPKGVPRRIPRAGRFNIDVTRTVHPFRVVRLWEVDPAPVLEHNDCRLLPWSLLMRSSDEDVRRVARILAEDGDEESIGRFLTLGSLRYDRSLLRDMLGARKMGLVEAILEGSSIVREVVDREVEKAKKEAAKEAAEAAAEAVAQAAANAAKENLARGLEEGQRMEARCSLRIVLAAKHPGLEKVPGIDTLVSVEKINALLQTAVTSPDRASVEQAIRAATGRDA